MNVNVLHFAPILSRFAAFFIASPFFSRLGIPIWLRAVLAISLTIFLAPLIKVETPSSSNVWVYLLLEATLGYLLGLIFSLLWEAASLAGQLVGTVAGFSITELLAPTSATHPLWGKTFVLLLSVLFFSLDLHHAMIKILHESFLLLPHASDIFNQETLFYVLKATSRLFYYAFYYSAFPLFILLFLIAILALTARILPELPIFWMGFPIQLFLGLTTVMIAVTFFPDLLQKNFLELTVFIQKIMVELGLSL